MMNLERDIFSEDIGYRKLDKNGYNDSYEEEHMNRDDKALVLLTRALAKALKDENHKMVQVWANQRDALLRQIRWKTLQKQVAGVEHVSSTI